MIFEVLFISTIGAFLSLDRTAVFQSMIAQPIIAAPIIGYFLGDLSAGVTIGALLQLLWVCALPVGSFIPPDETLATILITSCTILGTKNAANINNFNSFIVLNVLLLIPLAYLGSFVDIWIRNINAIFSHNADKECANFEFSKIERKNILGLLSFYLINFAVIFLLLTISINLLPYIYRLVPDSVVSGLELMYPIILMVGVGTLLFYNKIKNSLVIFAASFLFFSLIIDFFNLGLF